MPRKFASRRALPQLITASLPAPVGGWNARDSLGDMEATDAVIMDNVWPLTTSVMLRKGYSQRATGLGSQVETLLAYNTPSGTQRLFGAAGTSIFDCTAGGAVGAAVVTSLSNARWQYVNMSTSGGNFILAVNGADKLLGYNGTAVWHDGDGTHDITGLDTSTCIHINLHKNRVWFIVNNSLKAWYLGTNSIAGAANPFDLSSVAQMGGYLMAMGTWTIDAGYGVDDLAVFVTSVGEIIVYRGTDVSSSSTWALVGVWRLGAPLGRRCLMKYAGDLLVISQDGILPLASALQSSRLNPKVALTDKIQQVYSDSAGTYKANYGWQTIYYPGANMLLFNVPVSTGASQQQYAMNTISKAWARFKGLSANCFELFQDNLYFGGDGFVGKAWNTYADSGSTIAADVQQAYNYFGSKGQTKRWTMIRPTLLANSAPIIYATLNVDFNSAPPLQQLSYAATNYGLWGSSSWGTALWGSSLPLNAWQDCNSIGYAGAYRMQVTSSNADLKWITTDFVMEKGGIL